MYNIIFNPYAHRGTSKKSLDVLLDMLHRNGISNIVHTTEYVGHATKIVNDIIEKGGNRIIIVGGDGTIFEAINGCNCYDRITFGIIPAGTGNDIARMLNIPQNTYEATKIILKDDCRHIDFGLVNDSIKMVLFASYGIVIDIIMDCKRLNKKNRINYYISLLKNVFMYNAKDYGVIKEGMLRKYKADFISVQNAANAGGGMHICKDAVIDDGYLNVLIIKYNGVLRRILNFLSILRKKLYKQPNVICFAAEEIKISSPFDAQCCIDGEIRKLNFLNAKVKHNSIRFYCSNT